MKNIVSLSKLCEAIETRINNKFDLIIFIEGKRGMGKSTFLYQLAKKLNNRGLIKFNPKEHLVYSREDSVRILARSERCFLLNDEMINVAYNRDFYNQDQKELLKALNNYRDSCNVFGGCVPKFVDLDKQIQKLCEMRVIIKRRGLAEIHGQIRGVYIDDVWDTKNNQKKELHIKGNYKKSRTFRFYVEFPDLKEKERKFYEKLKHERRNRIFDKGENIETSPWDDFYNKLYEQARAKEMTKEQFENLCRFAGIQIKVARNRLNERFKDEGIDERLDHFLKASIKKKDKEKQKSKKIIVKKDIENPETPEKSESSSSQGIFNYNIGQGSKKTDDWDRL